MVIKAIMQMKVNDRAFEAIKAGTKTVEVRANKGQPFGLFTGFKCPIIFTNSAGETLERNIARVTLYRSVRELLEAEGCRNVLSSYNADLSEEENIAAGVISIENITADMGQGRVVKYKEIIDIMGVYAIVLV